jgi:hypothetical protein
VLIDHEPPVTTPRAARSRRARRPRRHVDVLDQPDRRALERAGWRTTLEYRENHVRGRNGRLLEVVPHWVAEAERFAGAGVVATASGETADEAWANLRAATAGATV